MCVIMVTSMILTETTGSFCSLSELFASKMDLATNLIVLMQKRKKNVNECDSSSLNGGI